MHNHRLKMCNQRWAMMLEQELMVPSMMLSILGFVTPFLAKEAGHIMAIILFCMTSLQLFFCICRMRPYWYEEEMEVDIEDSTYRHCIRNADWRSMESCLCCVLLITSACLNLRSYPSSFEQ
jgi:hypothetical protein